MQYYYFPIQKKHSFITLSINTLSIKFFLPNNIFIALKMMKSFYYRLDKSYILNNLLSFTFYHYHKK